MLKLKKFLENVSQVIDFLKSIALLSSCNFRSQYEKESNEVFYLVPN